MTQPELELVGAIYALYGYECVYWLKEGEAAYTCRRNGWHAWLPRVGAFTLLGRRPCLVNLLPFRAGLVRTDEVQPAIESAVKKLDEAQKPARMLRIAATAEAAALMAIVPACVELEGLRRYWALLVIVLLLAHGATMFLFSRELRRWDDNTNERMKHLLAAWLNPLAAVRCGDVLAQRAFAAISPATRGRR